MTTAKVFWSGRSQAVRLPKSFRFDADEVRIRRHGNAVILEPIADSWAWLDDMRIEIPARTADEPRSLVVGVIGDKHWSAVITYRSGRIRLISVRRSRPEEIATYEG